MVGAGGHYVWIDPALDAVVVLRWLDPAHAGAALQRIAAALSSRLTAAGAGSLYFAWSRAMSMIIRVPR